MAENSCGNPGTPENGIKVGDSYKYHDVVQFQCNEGYNLIGSSSRTCKTDNNWDGTQPTCQRKSMSNSNHKDAKELLYASQSEVIPIWIPL